MPENHPTTAEDTATDYRPAVSRFSAVCVSIAGASMAFSQLVAFGVGSDRFLLGTAVGGVVFLATGLWAVLDGFLGKRVHPDRAYRATKWFNIVLAVLAIAVVSTLTLAGFADFEVLGHLVGLFAVFTALAHARTGAVMLSREQGGPDAGDADA